MKVPGQGEVSTGAEASQPSGEKVSSPGRGAAHWSSGEGDGASVRWSCSSSFSWAVCAGQRLPMAPRPPWHTFAGLESLPPV